MAFVDPATWQAPGEPAAPQSPVAQGWPAPVWSRPPVAALQPAPSTHPRAEVEQPPLPRPSLSKPAKRRPSLLRWVLIVLIVVVLLAIAYVYIVPRA